MINFIDFDVKGIDISGIKKEFNQLNSDKFWGKEIDVNVFIINSKYKKFFFERDPYYKNRKYPSDNAFRAFYQPVTNEIFIFVDKYEHTNSIMWLLLHELAHHGILNSKILCWYFNLSQQNWVKEKFNLTLQEFYENTELNTSDEAHEENPEEIFANNLATLIMEECFDRKFWRERIINNKTRKIF